MKFKRLFFDSSIDLKAITKKRLILSIVIGITFTFIIYSFFYVARENLRAFSTSLANFPYILNESERFFHNLFYASLSIIFGNSIAVSFLFSRPQSVFSRRNNKRSRIINEQAFLNISFLHWFGKLGFLFGAILLDLYLLSDFYIFFLLLIIVMYLETFKTLNHVFGKKRFKLLLVHFFIFCSCTFCLAQFNILDYKRIDEISIKENPIMNVPNSNFHSEYDRKRNLGNTIKIHITENLSGNIKITNEYFDTLDNKGLYEEILNKKTSIRVEGIPFITINLIGDSSIKMKRILEFEENLYHLNRRRVNYIVNNTNIYSRRYEYRYISKYINEDVLAFSDKSIDDMPIPLERMLPPKAFDNTKFKDTLKIKVEDKIYIDELVVPDKMLARTLKNKINPTILIEYHISNTTTYQDYIKLLSAHKTAVNEIRQSKASEGLDINEKRYNLSKKQIDEIKQLRKDYPLIFKQINK